MWTNSCVQPQLLEFEVMQTVWILKGRRRPLSLWLAKQHLELYQNMAQLFLESIESAGNHLVNTSRSRGPYLFLCLCHRSLTAGRTMWLFGRMRFPAVSQDERPLSFPTRCDDISRSELAVATGALEEEHVLKKHHMSQKKWSKSNNFSHKTYYIYMKFRFRTIITKKKHKCLFPGDPKLPPTSLRFSTAALGGGSILLGNGWAAPGSRAGVCSLVFAPGNDKNDIEKTRRIRKKNLKRLIWGASFCYRTFLKDDESTVYVCACFNLCLDFFLWAYFPFLSGGDPSFKKIVGERLSSQTTSGVTRTWGAFIQSSLLNSCHRSPGYLVAEVVFYL